MKLCTEKVTIILLNNTESNFKKYSLALENPGFGVFYAAVLHFREY